MGSYRWVEDWEEIVDPSSGCGWFIFKFFILPCLLLTILVIGLINLGDLFFWDLNIFILKFNYLTIIFTSIIFGLYVWFKKETSILFLLLMFIAYIPMAILLGSYIMQYYFNFDVTVFLNSIQIYDGSASAMESLEKQGIVYMIGIPLSITVIPVFLIILSVIFNQIKRHSSGDL